MLAENLFAIVAIHRLESTLENWALLYLVPVMQHVPILDRADDFLATARDKFFFVSRNGLFQGYLTILNAVDAFQKVGNIADAVIKTLTAVWAW
jgi:hypothetical protein